MAMNITSITVEAKSIGIDELSKDLDKVASSSTNAQSSVTVLEKLLAKYQQQATLLGANTSQTNAYVAAMKGATDLEQHMAMMLGAEVDAYKALGKSQAEAIRINNEMDSAAARNKVSGDRFIQNLTEQATRLRLTGEELKHYNISLIEAQAKQMGMSAQAAPLIESLKQTGVAAHGAHSGIAGITREGIVLLHELSQGQFTRLGGSMMVMAEKFDVSKWAINGSRAAMVALGMSLAPFLVTIGAVIASVAALALAFVQAHHNATLFREMQNALILTGGSAGATANDLLELAHSATTMGGSLGEAKKTVIELAQTGKYTKDQIGLITESVVGLEHAAGIPIEKTIKQFEKLGDGVDAQTIRSTHAVSKNAAEMNAQYHFMDEATFARIIAMEKEGDATGALALATERLASRNAESVHQIEENMGAAMKQMRSWGREVLNWWNSIGEAQTAATTRANLVKDVEMYDASSKEFGGFGNQGALNAKAGAMARLAAFDETERLKQRQAAAQAANVLLDDQRIAAQKQIALALSTGKGLSHAQLEYESFKRNIALQTDEWQQDHAKENAQKLVELEKATHEKVKKERGIGLTGADLGTKQIELEYQSAQSAYSSHLKVIEHMHKTEQMTDENYQAAKISTLNAEMNASDDRYAREIKSLQEFNGKTQSERNIAAEKIAEIQKKQIKSHSDYADQISTASDVVRVKEIADAKALQEAANKEFEATNKKTQALQFENAAYLALPDSVRKAGITEKAMQDEITQQKINALAEDIAIGEASVDADSEAVRAKIANNTALMNALISMRDAQAIREKQVTDNVAALHLTEHEKSLSLAAAMEKAYKDAFKGMEDALVSFVKTGKLDFKSLADSIITDLIRIQVRQAMGSAESGGGWLGSLIKAGIAGLSGGAGTGIGDVGGLGLGASTSLPSMGGGTGISFHMADGGNVGAGMLGEVNERGPELFTSGGKQYLMTGSQGGTITPNDQLGKGGGEMKFTIVNQTTGRIDNVKEQRISDTERALIITEAVNATSASLYDSNSKMSKGLASTHNLQRKR